MMWSEVQLSNEQRGSKRAEADEHLCGAGTQRLIRSSQGLQQRWHRFLPQPEQLLLCLFAVPLF